MKNLQAIIEQAWEERDKITLKTKGPVRKAVATALDMLDSGEARVAEKVAGANDTQWVT
ncbi:MAG: 2,3,4,5-tetrahydropyridine-2,6-dicarboxylate N-succinyltransferase, partial [Aestuariivirga sp.]